MRIVLKFRPFLIIVGFAVLSFVVASDPAFSQVQQSLRDWQVSCDGDGNCAAETSATGRTDAVTYRFTLQFLREAQGISWRAVIRMTNAEPAASSAFILQIDDGASFRFEPDEIVRNDQNYELTGADEVSALIAAFRDDTENLWLTFHNPRIRETGLAFSLNGAVASILWIEEQQAANVTATPIPDRIVRLQALDQFCNTRDLPASFAPESYQVSENEWLHIMPCALGAYNSVVRLYLENRLYDEVRPLHFATYSTEFGWGGTNALIDARFDPETGLLTSFARGRGLGDCGSRAKYIWREYDFKLLEYAYWGPCDGTRMPGDWPIIYRAEK